MGRVPESVVWSAPSSGAGEHSARSRSTDGGVSLVHACCWRDRLTWVGAVVGTTVGSTVGAVVGATVGGVVGGTVGALVGATLGGTVGMTVGGRVGTRVGHMVGACREKGGAVPRQGARDESERL